MSSAKWHPFCLGLNVLRRILDLNQINTGSGNNSAGSWPSADTGMTRIQCYAMQISSEFLQSYMGNCPCPLVACWTAHSHVIWSSLWCPCHEAPLHASTCVRSMFHLFIHHFRKSPVWFNHTWYKKDHKSNISFSFSGNKVGIDRGYNGLDFFSYIWFKIMYHRSNTILKVADMVLWDIVALWQLIFRW